MLLDDLYTDPTWLIAQDSVFLPRLLSKEFALLKLDGNIGLTTGSGELVAAVGGRGSGALAESQSG
jgi:hypothetical protein